MTSGYQKRLVLCCVIAVAAFVFFKVSLGSSAQPAAAAEATGISPSTIVSVPPPRATGAPQAQIAPSNTRTYTNWAFDFSLTYPSDLTVTEYEEGGGTKSIVFQKPHAHVGFQMFITPDSGDDPLTPADIELDFPTLEMAGTQALTVGTGTQAIAFASEVPDFGPTQDLWLAHDGYLFEIVTYPNLGFWLAHIINTIRFP
jgi:hypothetical protein